MSRATFLAWDRETKLAVENFAMTPWCKAIVLLLPGFLAAVFANPARRSRRTIRGIGYSICAAIPTTSSPLPQKGSTSPRLDKKQWQQLKGKTVPEPGGLSLPTVPRKKRSITS